MELTEVISIFGQIQIILQILKSCELLLQVTSIPIGRFIASEVQNKECWEEVLPHRPDVFVERIELFR